MIDEALERIDPDAPRGASHRHMAAHLTGPFGRGAREEPLGVSDNGTVVIPAGTREPLLMIAPKGDLDFERLIVSATLKPPDLILKDLDFAPYTEAGSSLFWDLLPSRGAGASADGRLGSAYSVTLAAFLQARDGAKKPISAAELATRLEVTLLEGLLGRLIILLGAEKARIRRQAREMAAMRQVALAQGVALDRMGADLGVPRFSDVLTYGIMDEAKTGDLGGAAATGLPANAKKQIFGATRLSADGTRPEPEPDEEYRVRLELYRRYRVTTPRQWNERMNGSPGMPGLLAKIGVPHRAQLVETDNPFAVAIHLVQAGPGTQQKDFQDFLKQTYLILPADTVEAKGIHTKRYLPMRRSQEIDSLRQRLRANYTLPDATALAPLLAEALDRVGRCLNALGFAGPVRLLRSFSPADGSRYELGMGADITPLTNAELDQLAANWAGRRGSPPEIESLLKSMTPQTSSKDPDGSWLFEPCGLRTVFRVSNNPARLYLSHLPTFGMTIGRPPGAPATATPGQSFSLEARYHARLEPGSNVVLALGLQSAEKLWQADGKPAWTLLNDTDGRTRWQAARAPTQNARTSFLSAGLASLDDPKIAVERLRQIPEELLDTLVLAPGQSQSILNGTPEAARELRQLATLLQQQGIAALLPLVTGPAEVSLVVGAVDLPEVGANLNEQRTTGFRWYTVPLLGPQGTLTPTGSRAKWVAGAAGLNAVVVLGYARRPGGTDPYEVRVKLPDGALLNLRQYEFLMNALDWFCPIGVEINTWQLRQYHVDLDGSGTADPLSPSLARAFRRFRRSRNRGAAAVPLTEPLP